MSVPANDPQLSLYWKSALESYDHEDYSHSAALLQQFISESKQSNLDSPQAHFNLALSYWGMKKPAGSVLEFLKAAQFERSPLRIWHHFNSISVIQKNLGIKEATSDNLWFRFSAMGNPDITLLFGCASLWFFLGWFLLRWLKRNSATQKLLVALAFFCLLLAGAFFVGHRYIHLAVLLNEHAGTALYRSPTEKEEEKLAEFPSGTLVNVESEEKGFAEISHPVAGWVRKSNLMK